MGMPHRRSARTYVLMLVCALAFTLTVTAFGEDEVEEMQAVSTGVFTDEQAETGADAFALHCAHCHGAALQGGMGPRLAPLDPGVYRGEPLARPFEFMRTQMPFNAPGSLEDGTYLAILAFILRENGYAIGDVPLSTEDDALRRYVLDDPAAE